MAVADICGGSVIHRASGRVPAILMTAMVLCSIGVAQPQAAVAATDWLFSGTVVLDNVTSGEITINGDFTAPTVGGWLSEDETGMPGTYDLDYVCLIKRGDPNPDVSAVANYKVQSCRAGNTTFRLGATKNLEYNVYASAGAGVYDLWLHTSPSSGATWVAPTGAPSLSVVLPVKSNPSIVASAASVVAGGRVTFEAVHQITWSDGHVTSEPLGDLESAELQGRMVGASAWQEIGAGSPFTVILNDSVEARYLINREPSSPMLVTAIRETSKSRLTAPVPSKAAVFQGAPFALRFGGMTLYDDDQWRPTRRAKIDIQFSPSGKGRWVSVATSWINDGSGSKNLRATVSGYWRVRTDKAASPATLVRVKKP